eukprot:jgi/Chlat1/942/Chrsp108S01372
MASTTVARHPVPAAQPQPSWQGEARPSNAATWDMLLHSAPSAQTQKCIAHEEDVCHHLEPAMPPTGQDNDNDQSDCGEDCFDGCAHDGGCNQDPHAGPLRHTRKSKGNREAVRKYRERKKVQLKQLEEEVVRLRSLNGVLMRRLHCQVALEQEVVKLRSVMADIKTRLDTDALPPPVVTPGLAAAQSTHDGHAAHATAAVQRPGEYTTWLAAASVQGATMPGPFPQAVQEYTKSMPPRRQQAQVFTQPQQQTMPKRPSCALGGDCAMSGENGQACCGSCMLTDSMPGMVRH